GGAVKVKIENATGEVTKDQLARFTPRKGGPPPTETAEPPSPRPTPEETPERAPSPSRKASPTATPKGKGATPAQSDIPPEAAALIQSGASQYAAGNYDGAIASYTSAIRIAPRSGVAYLNRGNAYLYKSNFQAALADANKALELTVPKMDDVYNVRGTAKAGMNDFDGALADCNRALKINPRNALAYNNRANNKIKKGDYRGALPDCNKAISLDANSALPYYNRGFVRTNLGDQAGALADWQRAVALQPSFGAELNPKIAQLQALGVSSTRTSTGREPVYNAPSAEPQWTDLTNAPQKIVGTWQGGRHRIRFDSNGTFVTDPHLVPNPPRAQWQVQGDRLVQYYPQINQTTVMNIVSLTGRELVVRDPQGNTFRLTKLK
ncbi:MAG TPA: tetratricopeptide repeat protein, partial [Chthoniobacterales bacterium]|nr:tetratricopeptide repeat protein [Chthoniobacterales bacterium]